MPMVDPEIESAPWESQARFDAPLYLEQIEYLFERSRFYRDKLERAGFATHGAVGGLDAIAALPLTEKDELRASRSAEEPIGTHLTATSRRDRAHLFDQRHDGNAELHSAHRRGSRGLGAHFGALLCGVGDRERRADRLDLQRRTVRRRRRARRVRPARALPHPRRLGKHRAADDGDRTPETDRRRDDAVLCAASRGMGAPSAAWTFSAPA